MDQRERQVIDELSGKLRQVERQAPQRDAEAEAHIRQQVSGLAAAPYYMAQAILVQEQALANMQTRVQELSASLPSGRRRRLPRWSVRRRAADGTGAAAADGPGP